MGQPPRSTTADAAARAAAASPGAQRRHPADDLDLLGRDLEALARDVRVGARSVRESEDLEQEAQRIAAAIVAAFRGKAATRAPAWVSPCGLRAGW